MRSNSGVDKFTERLSNSLRKRGIRAEISWLPHRAEYLPWSVEIPEVPDWANVVHIHPWLHTRFIPKELPCVATLHSCVHDPALRPYKSILQSLYHQGMMFHRERSALKRADAITAVSHYTSNMTKRFFDCGNIEVIHNSVDTQSFYPSKDRRPNKPFRLLYVGSIRLLKGVDLLPEIMATLGCDFELHFTGTLEALSRFDKIPPNIIPLGWVSNTKDMRKAYQNCDALLFPTRLEGLPLTTLEAMACGLPVIATNIASLPEVIASGKTGLLCGLDNINDFVTAAKMLRINNEETTKMSHNARKHIKENFSERLITERYIRLYKLLRKNH